MIQSDALLNGLMNSLRLPESKLQSTNTSLNLTSIKITSSTETKLSCSWQKLKAKICHVNVLMELMKKVLTLFLTTLTLTRTEFSQEMNCTKCFIRFTTWNTTPFLCKCKQLKLHQGRLILSNQTLAPSPPSRTRRSTSTTLLRMILNLNKKSTRRMLARANQTRMSKEIKLHLL